MNRLKITARNIIIIIILFLLFLNRAGLYLTPTSAHEHSERSIHYGPSTVVHVEDFDKGKYFLGKYDKWISCNTINRSLYFFWSFGNQASGVENDLTKDIFYRMSGSSEYLVLYGIRNNKNIERVEIVLGNERVYTITDFYEDMFLFSWKTSGNEEYYPDLRTIRGYDSNDNLVFEDERIW
jgi:hypothetical protein